jgi:hypothetical protein
MAGQHEAAVSDEELKQALAVVFRANSALYRERGFQRRLGFGKRPALLIIDLARAWTEPGHAFSCAEMDPSSRPTSSSWRRSGRAACRWCSPPPPMT